MKRRISTTNIRIARQDLARWKTYCRELNTPSSRLFNKILNSENLSLEKKIKEERRKRDFFLGRK